MCRSEQWSCRVDALVGCSCTTEGTLGLGEAASTDEWAGLRGVCSVGSGKGRVWMEPPGLVGGLCSVMFPCVLLQVPVERSQLCP